MPKLRTLSQPVALATGPTGWGSIFIGLWLSILFATATLAAEPEQVVDLDPRTYPRGSAPTDFVEVVGQTFFVADQGEIFNQPGDGPGRELWVTDGTAEGTHMVRDQLGFPPSLGPLQLTPVGSRSIVFHTQTIALGAELWGSDGTVAGTAPLRDFCPGRCGSFVDGITPFGSRVLFHESTEGLPSDPTRQWVTDGTPQGTEPFQLGDEAGKIVLEGDGFLDLQFLISTRDGESFPQGWREELWISDGTAAGSFSLAAAFPSLGLPAEGRLYGLQLMGERALFFVETGDGQRTLWHSDGTVAGTAPLASLPPIPSSSVLVPRRYLPWADLLNRPVFLLLTEPEPGIIDCELWATDGSSAGTSQVVSLQEAAGFAPDDFEWFHCPTAMVRVLAPPITPPGLDHAFFSFSDFETFSQLWVSDGTAAGTRAVHDYGPTGVIDLGTSLTPWQSQLFFFDNDDEGAGLFTPSGTNFSTVKVQSLGSGYEDNLPQNAIGEAGFPLIFQGWDPERGSQLWTSLGSEADTRHLVDLDMGQVSSQPTDLLPAPAESGEQLVFLARHPGPHGDGLDPAFFSRRGLWASDGTADGTRLLVDGGVEAFEGLVGKPVLTPTGLFVPLNDTVQGDSLLFSSDLETFETVARFSFIEEPVAFGDLVCFSAVDPDIGREPWCSDGTEDGLVSLGDLAPGTAQPPFGGSDANPPFSSNPNGFQVAGRYLYFRTASYVIPEGEFVPAALWRTDGTAAGTRRVWSSAQAGDPGPVLSSDVGPLMAYGNDLYFLVEDLGQELWRLRSGVVAEPVGRMGQPGDRIRVTTSSVFRERLIFLAEDGTGVGTLWSTDGGPTPSGEGARRLADFSRIYNEIDELPLELVAVGNDLYFAADGGDGAGLELWATDGTAPGTRRVTELAPGSADSFPQHLQAIGSRLFFSATDGEHGHEPWVTDGTAVGTAMVADLEPGVASSEPRDALRRGDQLYFSAWTSAAGRELHRLELSDLLSRSCVEENQRFCLRDGRFEVLVDWVDPRSLDAGRGTGTPYLGSNGSDDTGQVWFFRDDNRELAVKILDGRPINDHHWLFYGALTDVAYWLSGVDLETGVARTWASPAREICGDADDRAFPEDPATGIGPTTPSFAIRIPAAAAAAAEAEEGPLASALAPGSDPNTASSPVSVGPPCDDPQELCLQDGRFRLKVDWRDQRRPGRVGVGTRIPDTERSGAFWFFREGNLELLVKVLDARTVDGHFWIFYGNLTDVEFDLHVTDLVTGRTKTYTNPGGSLCGDADTTFF